MLQLRTQQVNIPGLVCPRDDDQIGSPESPDGFTQTPAREQSPAAERVSRVNRNNVEVARDAQVLKSIIEDEDLALEIRYRPVRRRDAISIAYDRRHRAKRFGQQSRLVASLKSVGQNGVAVRD
jgi:hypothetical protein